MSRPRPIAPVLCLMVALSASGCGDPLAVLGDNPGIMRIVAGTPNSQGSGEDSVATAAQLDDPADVVLSQDGVLYVADRGDARILAVSSGGRLQTLRNDRFCATQPCLAEPTDLALDSAGGLLVADRKGHRLWRLNVRSGAASILAGTGASGATPDGQPARGSPLQAPAGVAVGGDGTIYLSEQDGHRIRTISADGILGTLAGTGSPGFSGDGGPAGAARLNRPAGLALGGGFLYVADESNDRIRAVDLGSGKIRTVAGSGDRGYAGDGGPATGATLQLPEDVTVAPGGDLLYVADTQNHRVREVDLRSSTITTFAGTGSPDFTQDLLDAGATGLRLPSGVFASSFGLLFVADTGHQVVWRVPIEF